MIEIALPSLAIAAATAGGRLPFPLADDEPVVTAAPPGDIPMAELRPLLADLLAPRRIVYSVVVGTDGGIRIAVALEGTTGTCVGVAVSDGMAQVSGIGSQHLVQFLVDSVAATGVFASDPLFDRPFTVPQDCFAPDDRGATAELLRAAGVPDSQVVAWLSAGRPVRSGLLGAVAAVDGRQHHVRSSVAWRTYAHGSLLLVEPSTRSRKPERFEVLPLDRSRLTHAAIDLLAALNRQVRAEYATLSGTHH